MGIRCCTSSDMDGAGQICSVQGHGLRNVAFYTYMLLFGKAWHQDQHAMQYFKAVASSYVLLIPFRKCGVHLRA